MRLTQILLAITIAVGLGICVLLWQVLAAWQEAQTELQAIAEASENLNQFVDQYGDDIEALNQYLQNLRNWWQ